MAESKAVRSIQDEIKAEIEGLKDRVEPPSGFKISTKGKMFTLPNGSSSEGPLSCVILDWVTANIYFKGIYNPNDIKPPACWAISDKPADLAPSENVPDAQNKTCKGCPQNEWGSGTGKGKACKNTRRLLVVPADADEKSQPWVLDVSPTGLKHFDKYVNALADMGMHPIQLVTDISFDESEAYPSLRFKALDPFEDLEVAWALKDTGQAILHQEPKIED
jgi:hypothetical protein